MAWTTTEDWIRAIDECSLTSFVKSTDLPDQVSVALESGDWELLLHRFAQSEYSPENVEFLRAVAVFERSGDLNQAKEIYDHYVSSSAASQVNLPSGSKNALDEIFGPGKDGIGPPSLFDDAKYQITQMIQADTYRRFKDGIGRAKPLLP